MPICICLNKVCEKQIIKLIVCNRLFKVLRKVNKSVLLETMHHAIMKERQCTCRCSFLLYYTSHWMMCYIYLIEGLPMNNVVTKCPSCSWKVQVVFEIRCCPRRLIAQCRRKQIGSKKHNAFFLHKLQISAKIDRRRAYHLGCVKICWKPVILRGILPTFAMMEIDSKIAIS